MRAIEVTPDEHAQAGTATAPSLLVDLQDEPADGDGVVARHDPFFLVTEDLLEVVAADGDERGSGIRGWPGEAGVVVGNEALAQVAVRRGHGGDVGDAELVHEAPSQGPIRALAAASRRGQ